MKIKNLLLILTCQLIFTINASSQVFKYIVATDGSGDFTSIQSALNACPDGQTSMIFIKNGTYNEQVTLGTKAAASTKKISLIGESYGGVLITHSQSRASSGSPTYEDVCTVKFYATDLYAENISIQNAAGNTGMAEALYTAGDRQIFRNCKVLGYQDTYRSKKGTRGYFKNCWIEGAVDFIYAGGTLFLDDCTINCVNGGGHIVAPEDSYTTKASTVSGKTLNLGFVFRRCNITANSDVATASYDLGRPWNINSGAYYLNCTLGKHIKPAGWATMSGNETTASFAEYNSMNPDGTPASVSGRISWSFQLQQYDADSLLNPQKVYSTTYTTTFDPITKSTPTAKPENLSINGSTISWSAVSGAIGYVVYKDGKYLGSVTGVSSVDNSGITGSYSVRALNSIGVLSEVATLATALSDVEMGNVGITINHQAITLSQRVEKMQLVTTTGNIIAQKINESILTLNNLSQGIYLLRMYDKGMTYTKKIILGTE
ncbi:MAG: pectinesterase family protein [Paludibacter sp.]|nr:pectinesterase family protein [Paludibacter sp.]